MEEKRVYQTGDVQLPKQSQQGSLLLLLLLLILCLVSTINMANLQYRASLEQPALLKFDFREVPGPNRGEHYRVLGITGCYLTQLEQEYFSLPAGFYIAKTNNTLLKPGDVLVAINGRPLENQAAFEEAVQELVPDTEITLQLRRGSRLISVTDLFYEGDE